MSIKQNSLLPKYKISIIKMYSKTEIKILLTNYFDAPEITIEQTKLKKKFNYTCLYKLIKTCDGDLQMDLETFRGG
jgi:hypothetical protein